MMLPGGECMRVLADSSTTSVKFRLRMMSLQSSHIVEVSLILAQLAAALLVFRCAAAKVECAIQSRPD